MLFRFIVPLILLTGWAPAATHTSSLIKGMPGPDFGHSYPHKLSRHGDKVLFWAGDPAHGTALRVLDLKDGSVRIVWDFELTSTQIRERPSPPLIAVAHGWLIPFSTSLWFTDGTTQGTRPLLQWNKSVSLTTAYQPLVRDGIMYFGAADPEHGHELWRSDGTAEGTWRVKDLRPGPESGAPEHLTMVGDRIFFSAAHPEFGEELWVTDGTEDGTRLVKDIYPGPSSSHILDMCALGETAILVASNGTHGAELWKSNGTSQGTTMIVDLSPGYTAPSILELTPAGSQVFFSAHTQAAGRELWATDGTAAGTRMVKDLLPGSGGASAPPSGSPSGFMVINNRVVFTAYYGTDTLLPRLYSSDGTPAGTFALHPGSLRPDWFWDSFAPMPVYDGAIWFIAPSGPNFHRALWRTDGTAQGTRQVYTSGEWSASSGTELFCADDSIYLAGTTMTALRSGIELWKYHVPGKTLSIVANLCPDGWQSPPDKPFATSHGLYFKGHTAAQGYELWRSRGTAASTSLVFDVNPGTADSNIQEWADGPDGRVFFSANTAAAGQELWSSNGTAAGTAMVRDIVAGTQGGFPSGLQLMGDRLFFSSRSVLWTSDGTRNGTSMVKEIRPPGSSVSIRNLTNLGGQLIFLANDGVHGLELWKSDGTAEGTALLKDIYTGSGDVTPQAFGTAGNRLFFEHRESTETYGLYVTDGTADGTRWLSRPRPNVPADTAAIGDTFYFIPVIAPDNEWLWKSDGTPDGTVAVKHLVGPRGPGKASQLTAAGSLVFLNVSDPVLGDQLWRSDGTEAGTFPLIPDAPDWDPVRMVQKVGAVEGRVYFAATTYRHGRELWVTDGSAAGTVLAIDLAPGEPSSLPRWVGTCEGRVFGIFSADPESQSPGLRSIVHPDAAPVFLGLEFEAWEGDSVALSVQRLLSLVEAPPGTPMRVELGDTESQAGGSLAMDGGILTYTAPAGHQGGDRFTVRLTGHDGPPVPATVTVHVATPPPYVFLQPILIRQPNGTVDVFGIVQRGRTYVFDRSIDLQSWTTLETRHAGVSETALWTDPDPPASQAIYRVRPVP